MTQSIFAREPQPCMMARLSCPTHGPVRMALPQNDEPPAVYDCPYCLTEVPMEILGVGKTIRDLPFFEYEGALLSERQPPSIGNFARLHPGQIVVFCEELDVLHLAAVSNIHTALRHLGPTGVPSISFVRGGEETEPVPHVSASEGVPPFWLLPAEGRDALKAKAAPAPPAPTEPKQPKLTKPTRPSKRGKGTIPGETGTKTNQKPT